MDDITLHSWDPKARKAVYKGRTPLATGRGIEFDLVVDMGSPDAVTLSLDVGELRAGDFDAGRRRLALWLRNVAEALDGTVSSSIPRVIDRASDEQVHRSEGGADRG